MSLKFNLNRPPVSDEEIDKQKDFQKLLKQFREQSIKKAQSDETWWKNKKIRYSTVIAGLTVVCTVTYLSIQNSKISTKNKAAHEITTTSATNKSSKSTFIQPPSGKLKSKNSVYRIDAAKGASLTHSTSTKINIPGNVLVNKAGRQIVGEVTIEYKEMKDLGDALLNGIPMAYDSAGKHNNLETAGMFDIRAYQNGEPVFLKQGENIEIRLASENTENRFNQYFLDTVKQNWIYLKKDELSLQKEIKTTNIGNTNNQKLQSLQNEIEVILPHKIDSVTTQYTRSVKQLPVPAEPNKPEKSSGKRPVFVIDASTKDYPELAAYENTVFEVGNENKNYSKELHDITWNDVRILPGPQKGKNYILRLSYRNRSEELVVYPVVQAGDFEKAQQRYEKQFQSYQQKLQMREEQEQRLLKEMQSKQEIYFAQQKIKKEEYEKEQMRQALLYRESQTRQLTSGFSAASNASKAERVFKINQFGIFNSDCPHPVPVENSIRPVFVMEGKGNLVLPDRIYLIDHQAKTVVGYDAQNATISFDNPDFYSICVFRQGKVFVCSKNNFKETVANKSKEFKVKPLPDSAENPEDFKKFLGI
jgi:hypothetical protein